MLDVTHKWLQSMDMGKEVCAIFFDLRKAFDSVPHRSLFEKLKGTRINAYLLFISWLYSYLKGREQSVVLDSKTLTSIPVLSGVPQGSVLGPLFFLIYINYSASEQLDIGTYLTMYADDLLFHREINCSDNYLRIYIKRISIKYPTYNNRLTLNSKKCKIIITSRRHGRSVRSELQSKS